MLVRQQDPPWRTVVIIASLVTLATILVLLFHWPSFAPQKHVEQKTVSAVHARPARAQTSQVNISPIPDIETSHRAVAVIATDDLSRKVRTEVERLTRPNPTALALFDDGNKRLACLLVDNPEHYYQLDHGFQPGQFAALDLGSFQIPPEPVAKSISRYRSVAKQAMGYRATGEDRLIILLCPASEWPALDLTYRDYEPGALPGTSEVAPKPQF